MRFEPGEGVGGSGSEVDGEEELEGLLRRMCGWGLEAYIVPSDTNYSMILGRPWMREVGAIRLDAFDEY